MTGSDAAALPDWLVPLARAAADLRPEHLSRFTPPGEGERASAVLILLGEGPQGPDVLIIRRSDALRNHAGQAAFPGGSLDPGESATEAALREAQEETGLDPAGVEVLAVLPELFIPFSGFAVTPVLGWWREPSPVRPVDPGEVAAVVRVPLSALGRVANRVAVTHPSGLIGPGFVLSDMLVWGFTAGLLARLLELGGLIPTVDLDTLPQVGVPSQPTAGAGPEVDLLDVLLLAAVVGFAISGYRQGSVVGVLSLVGFVGGALLGAQIATPLAQAFGANNGGSSPGFGLITVVATAVIGQIIAAAIGARLRSRLTWKPLRALDSIAGALVSAVSVLLVAWALGHVVVRTDHPQIRAQVTRSVILKRVDSIVPGGADSLLAALLRLVNQTGFPAVFPGLGIEQIVPVPKPDPAVLATPGVKSAYPSIVKINGDAPECQRSIEGSGFVFGPDRVMTNAHVVAGVTSPMVSTPGGQVVKATVVLFDPLRDVAVLDVPGLTSPKLTFAGPLGSGASAAVAGYPNNMPFDARPARVRALRSAQNYDIYSTETVTREEYSLFTQVRPGNSGGPLLDTSGHVDGVVFATSTDDPNTGYALSAHEVAGDATAGLTATRAVSTQGCD